VLPGLACEAARRLPIALAESQRSWGRRWRSSRAAQVMRLRLGSRQRSQPAAAWTRSIPRAHRRQPWRWVRRQAGGWRCHRGPRAAPDRHALARPLTPLWRAPYNGGHEGSRGSLAGGARGVAGAVAGHVRGRIPAASGVAACVVHQGPWRGLADVERTPRVSRRCGGAVSGFRAPVLARARGFRRGHVGLTGGLGPGPSLAKAASRLGSTKRCS